MRDLELQVRYPKRIKVTTDSNHNEVISPNRLDRQFQVAKPNQVRTNDITYVWTLQGCDSNRPVFPPSRGLGDRRPQEDFALR